MNTLLGLTKKVSVIHVIITVIVISFTAAALLLFTRKQQTVLVDLTSYPQEWNPDPFPPAFTEIDSLQVGDSAYNWSGKQTAEITRVEKSEWEGNRKSILMTVRLHVIYDPRTRQYLYNDIPVIVGNKLTLNTQKTLFTGGIINVYTNENDRYRAYTKKEARIKVHIRYLEPWQAESLRNFESKNSLGEIIAKTTDITITPAEEDVETDRGVIYKGYSTVFKDALVTLHLTNVYCSDQTCYFNDSQPLRVGYLLEIQSSTAFIEKGSIVEVTIL